jgi:hypothetical protein
MKAFFLSRLLREKVLLVALVLTAAVIWLSGAGERAGKLSKDISNTSTDLKAQELVLSQKDDIEARSRASVARLDPARTFDPVRLQSEINTIANQVGLGAKTNINGQPSELSNQFAIHSVNVVTNNADYLALTKFYVELQKRSPYIGIEQFNMVSSSPGSSVLRQQMRVVSFGFAK